MTITQAKRRLKEVSQYREKIRAVMETKKAMKKAGFANAEETARQAIDDIEAEVAGEVRTMLLLPPDESRTLIARYINCTPYVDLSRDDLLAGMTQRTAERILARAVEHYAEISERGLA